MQKQTGDATFFGTASLRARLWQGGSQVEAPVLVFARSEATLDAYGTNASEALPVRTVLVGRAGESPKGASGAVGGVRNRPQVLRVQSGRLHYAEGLRRAEFSKGVVLDGEDGTMTSRAAVAILAAALAPKTGDEAGVGESRLTTAGGAKSVGGQAGAMSAGLPGGGLERVTATGDVVVRQPGRVATGQQAVYTASDGEFVLTGGEGVLPKVLDAVNGSVTGAALRFRSGDNSVTVEGRAKDGAPVTGDGRVHTRTRVKQ